MVCLICGGQMRLVSSVDLDVTLDDDVDEPFRVEQQLDRQFWQCTECKFECSRGEVDQ